MRKYFGFLMLFLSLFLTISCTQIPGDNNGNNNEQNEEEVKLPTSIEVSNKKDEICIGESFTINVDVLPSDATDKSYEIVSYPEGIVEINGNTIIGKAYGETCIIVRSKVTSSVVNQFNVKVKYDNESEGLFVSSFKSILKVNETESFNVIYNGDLFTDFSYMTLPEGIVEISGNTINAIQPGTTKLIIFKNGNYNEKIEIDITVYQDDLEVFGINEYMSLDETSSLQVSLFGTLISNNDYTISISDNEVLSVQDGVIKALKIGTTDVTISLKDYPDKTITFTVNVLSDATKRPESVEVNNVY